MSSHALECSVERSGDRGTTRLGSSPRQRERETAQGRSPRQEVQVPMLARDGQHDRRLSWLETNNAADDSARGSEREQRKVTSARLIGEGWDIKKHWVGRERSDQEPEDV
jgi:hypothetical protein